MKRTYKIARQREPRELIAQSFDVAEIDRRPETLKDIQMSAPAVLRSIGAGRSPAENRRQGGESGATLGSQLDL
jgi:hypothetical protein